MYSLEIEKLCKTYKNGVKALDSVNLAIEQGDFFGFIGPNGAGKSTLINIVSSLCKKSSGRISICGYDLDKQTLSAKRLLGIVPQELNFNILETPYEIVVNQARFYGVPTREAKRRAKELLIKLDLWGKRKVISQSLSGGMKRRLMIARGLVHNPALLLLDEPTVGVDVEQRRTMWEFLKEINSNGTAIILTTHYLEEAEKLCNNIAFILGGKIIENINLSTLVKGYQNNRILVDVANSIVELPLIQGVDLSYVSDNTMEIVMKDEKNVSNILYKLLQSNIAVVGVRNTFGKLEDLLLLHIERERKF